MILTYSRLKLVFSRTQLFNLTRLPLTPRLQVVGTCVERNSYTPILNHCSLGVLSLLMIAFKSPRLRTSSKFSFKLTSVMVAKSLTRLLRLFHPLALQNKLLLAFKLPDSRPLNNSRYNLKLCSTSYLVVIPSCTSVSRRTMNAVSEWSLKVSVQFSGSRAQLTKYSVKCSPCRQGTTSILFQCLHEGQRQVRWNHLQSC